MIEKLPQFPEYTAVIVGKTTPKFEGFAQSLKKDIEDAGLSDRFLWLGEVEFDELPSLYGAMSIVAAVSRVEGFGLTCLEAMSAGAPVIASRAGGFEMVVRDGIDGRIVDCNNSDAVAEAFTSMAENPSRLREMACSGRSRVEESFSIEREAKELVDAYDLIARS
jgi:mannosyltransferase